MERNTNIIPITSSEHPLHSFAIYRDGELDQEYLHLLEHDIMMQGLKSALRRSMQVVGHIGKAIVQHVDDDVHGRLSY